MDDGHVAILQTEMSQIQAELQNEQVLDEARRNLTLYKAREETYRPLVPKGVITRVEYDEVLQNVQRNEDIIRRWTDRSKRQIGRASCRERVYSSV